MLRFIGIIFAVVLIALISGVAYAYVRGEQLITDGVSVHGSKALGAEVKLGGVGLDVLGGSAALSDFSIGHPEGFEPVDAFAVGRVAVDLNPMSLISDTIEIELIDIASPDIRVEPKLNGTTNLQQLQANIMAYVGPLPEAEEEAPATDMPNLIVKKFVISGAKLGFIGGDTGLGNQTLKLQDIVLTDIGVKEGGVPASDLMRLASDAIMPQVTAAMASAQGKKLISDITGGKVNVDSLKEDAATEVSKLKNKAKKKIGKKLKGLFGKKKDSDG